MSQEHIDQVNFEQELRSPVSRPGNTGMRAGYIVFGLLAIGGVSWALGSGADAERGMTDPTDESWYVSSVDLRLGAAKEESDKRGDRIELMVEEEIADEPVETEDDTVETFEVPAPDVDLGGAPGLEELRSQPEMPAVTTARVVGPENAIFEAKSPDDYEVVGRVNSAPAADEVGLPDVVLETSAPAESEEQSLATEVGMPEQYRGFPEVGAADTESIAEEELDDSAKWARYRSKMVVFDQSKEDEAAEEELVESQPTIAPRAEFGLFSGNPDS